MMVNSMSKYVLGLDEISPSDFERCGGKAGGLGELTRIGVRVPPGFCVVGESLEYLLEANSLTKKIADIAATLNFDDYAQVDAKTTEIRSMIEVAKIPADMEQEVRERYRGLVSEDHKYVAVRSSVAVKGSQISSFPGMMDTYHYVLGEDSVLEKIRECWASLWTARAAFARFRQNIAHENGVIAPIVQLMVHSETAGVLFTANPITKSTKDIVIEANWGLGESVVSGKSMNDFFCLDKATLTPRERKIAPKTVMVTMDDSGAGRAEREVPPEKSKSPTLSQSELIELGRIGKKIEKHFGFNVDVEWAFHNKILYILQTRKIRNLEESAKN